MYFGYEPTSPLSVGGVSTFFLIDSNGGCVASGSTGSSQIELVFGADFDITCTSSDNNINLFNFFGKKVSKYNLDSSAANMLTIPWPTGSFSAATIYFIVSTYGSQRASFIQEVRVIGSKASPGTRNLSVRFIQPELDYDAEAVDPSFFPQIPYDIFFPIHQIAFTI